MLMGLYDDLKELEPFTLSYHADADGIYSASLLMSIFNVKSADAPEFGLYNCDVSVDLGPPADSTAKCLIAIDHHPNHPANKPYKLYTAIEYPTAPVGLAIYDHLKPYIPKEQLWKVIGSLVGDGQAEFVPDEIWELYPILLEERGKLSRGQFKLYATGFPMYYMLSSGINAISRLGFPSRALEIVNEAKSPFDILDNVEVMDAIERVKAEEDSILKSSPIAETIKNRYVIIKIKPSSSAIDITSYLASKISAENQDKTIIVINTDTGKISIRGVLAKYVANKLASMGFRAGGHPGYCAANIKPSEVDAVVEAVRCLL